MYTSAGLQTVRSVVSRRQLGVLFDVVLLIDVQPRNEERPQRLLGRRVKQSVHLSHELRYVPTHRIQRRSHVQRK